jgi:hypothetical protein
MGLLRRGHRAEHDRLAHQHAQERALAGAQVSRGGAQEGWAVATAHRLVLAFGDDVVVRRWCDVDHGALDAQSAELTIRWVDGAPETVITLTDAKPQAFARTFRERVQSSVVHSETVKLPQGGVVRVVVRRDEADGLFSEVLGDGYVRLDDPETAALVAAAETRVREAVGLPL